MKSAQQRSNKRILDKPLVTLFGLAQTLALFAASAASQSYVFNRADFTTGTGPVAVAVGDFNGDGRPDVAVVNSGANSVSILLGQPNGTLGPKRDFAVGGDPSAVVVGDFNGDGKLDLAVANSVDSTVTILQGDGTGFFMLKSTVGTGSSPNPGTLSIAAGDFTGDGRLDLVVADESSGTISILLGKGDGTFTLGSSPSVGVEPVAVAVADFRNNHKLDLVVTDGNESYVSVLLGKGNGTFESPQQYATGSFGTSVVTGDFNRDGKIDIAAASFGSGSVSVLLGSGDGTFHNHVDYPAGTSPYSVSVGDFKGDGKLDLAVANYNVNKPGGVSILLGNGNGTFASPVAYGVGGEPSSLTLADLNGDGKLDVVSCNYHSDTVSVLLGRGDGRFINRTDYATGKNPRFVLTSDGSEFRVPYTDFNNDNIPDIAVANAADHTVSIYLGNGDGTFQAPKITATGKTPVSLLARDFDGDGNLDLAVANQGDNTVSVLLGKGDGTFSISVAYDTGHSPTSVTRGHFTGSGVFDLVVANSVDNTVSVLLTNGNGTFQAQKVSATGKDSQSVDVHAIFGAPVIDAVTANLTDNTISVLPGNSNGTYQTPVPYPTGGTSPRSAAYVDINNDSFPDILAVNSGSNNVGVLLNNGMGMFGSATTFATGNMPVAATIGDFNRDKNLDGVTVNQTDNTFSLLLGNGDGTFQPHLDYTTGAAPSSVSSEDFELANRYDLAVTNSGANTLSVYLNTPVIALFPTRVNFGNRLIGTTGGTLPLTVSNPSGSPLSITNIAASGDFSQTNNCPIAPSVLKAGTNCTVNVSFAPTSLGVLTGTIALAESVPGSPHAVALTGDAYGPVAFSPASLSFTTQTIGTTSSGLVVNLTNDGITALKITGIGIVGGNAGDFSQSNNCPLSPNTLGVGASCSVIAKFAPTASGSRKSAISVSANGGGSPQVAVLTGVGNAADLAPVSLRFTSQTVDTSSTPQTTTLTNKGRATMHLFQVAIGGANAGDFSKTTTCGATLGAGLSCKISVTFKPTATGLRTATVLFSDDGGGSPQAVGLTGTGTN